MQRVKGSKGQNVIEVHSRLGHLKNILHPSLFPEEDPSCNFSFYAKIFHKTKYVILRVTSIIQLFLVIPLIDIHEKLHS